MYSAGILPVYNFQVLLGKEKRGWSGFSGKYESEKDVTVMDTAIREFTEETAGLLEKSRVQWLIKEAPLLKSCTPKDTSFIFTL